MAKSTKLLPATDTGFEVGARLELDKQDIIDIGITEAEEHMQEQLQLAKDEEADCKKEMAKLREINETIVVEASEAHWSHVVDDLAPVLKDNLGCKKFDASYTGNETFVGKANTLKCNASMCMTEQGCKHQHGVKIVRTEVITMPAEYKLNKQRMKDLSEQEELARKAQLEWKRRLTQIPQMERKLRAELAKTRLNKSVEGREVLDAMLNGVRERVLKLPG